MTMPSVALVINNGDLFLLMLGIAVLLATWFADLRRARREAEAASRMKDEFLGTISHELRTPLNAVLGWLHLIRTGKLDRATEHRGLDAIERNVRLQAQLTGDLLDMSKSLTGRLNLELHTVSLTRIVAEALSQVRTAATAKQVTVHASNADGPVVVRGDPNRLRQIVWHLLANAIKFTPRGGEIDVAVGVNDHASVTITDTGIGIDPTFLPRVFDRFTQADSSPTRTSGGLGVGLSLVRELVERHGGRIRAMNRVDGSGAVFVVELPIRREDQIVRPRVRPSSSPDGGAPPLDGVRVLLLDPDRDTRELAVVVLEQHGVSVRATGSIDQALEMLESWRPDVLVSDASPDRDRYVLVGKVHSLEPARGGRIPALALTTAARTDEGMRLLSDVRCDVSKPLDPRVLVAEIARLTGRERRRVARA